VGDGGKGHQFMGGLGETQPNDGPEILAASGGGSSVAVFPWFCGAWLLTLGGAGLGWGMVRRSDMLTLRCWLNVQVDMGWAAGDRSSGSGKAEVEMWELKHFNALSAVGLSHSSKGGGRNLPGDRTQAVRELGWGKYTCLLLLASN
jgi:hypothetical protein